jgi:sulfur carrier protein ThiS
MVVTVTLPAIPQSPPRSDMERQFDVTLLSGSTLADLIPDLGVELPLEKTVLQVNGHPTGTDTVLYDGDQVNLIPAISDNQAG